MEASHSSKEVHANFRININGPEELELGQVANFSLRIMEMVKQYRL